MDKGVVKLCMERGNVCTMYLLKIITCTMLLKTTTLQYADKSPTGNVEETGFT